MTKPVNGSTLANVFHTDRAVLATRALRVSPKHHVPALYSCGDIMTHPPKRVRRAALAAVAAGCTGLALAVPYASAQASATDLFTITQNVLPGLANATDLGATAASTPMNLVITVSRPNVSGE